MEFEFGTNWAQFSRASGGVIGQPLAMEGVFSFFLESAFLGLFLYGRNRLSKRMHWFSAVMVFLGSWLSGFFIIVTDAWLQHPVGSVWLTMLVGSIGLPIRSRNSYSHKGEIMTVRENLNNKIRLSKKTLFEVQVKLKGELSRSDRAYFEAIETGAKGNIESYQQLLRTSRNLDQQID